MQYEDEDDMVAAWQRAVERGDMKGALNLQSLPRGSSAWLEKKMNFKPHQAEMLARTKADLIWMDEAHNLDEPMRKMSGKAAHAASLLEEMAKKFSLNFKNMDDFKYRVFGEAYLKHELLGVKTGRYYDAGVHIIDGNEAVNLSLSARSGRWSTESLAQQKAVDYIGFIAELKQYIVAGYALSVIALKVMDFFNVGTNAVSYRVASYIARRLHDLIFLVDGGNVNNSFWRSMATMQLVIKRHENEHQHVGYASETDLRGLATSVARHPTFTVANQMIMSDNIDNAYRHYYA